MGDPGPLRASDSERERSADDLREHYTSGRITAQELSDRLDAVYAASTHSELAALSGDLPALRTAPTVDPQRDLARRRV